MLLAGAEARLGAVVRRNSATCGCATASPSAGCARLPCATTCRTGSRSIRRIQRPLADFDVILMRKDPPFDMEYIYTTYILERAEEQGVLVVNRPQGLRDMNEKVFTAWFPQCCAPTLITRDMADMHAFLRRARRASSASRCTAWAAARSSSSSAATRTPTSSSRRMTEYGTRFAIVQRYIPDIVATGDSRILRHRRRARAVRAGAHPDADRQPRQPRRRRARRGPRAQRARPLARRRRSARRCGNAGCCSSAST